MSGISPYQPLNASTHQIRVLDIIGVRPVRGKFEYVSLDDKPVYDAISWQWGDTTLKATVEVDGALILIPSNALCVLQDLCIGHSRLRVWLDAVCINQQDEVERSQQVAFMSEIYQAARQTLVWLGQDDGSTEAAIDNLDYLDAWRKTRHNKHDGCDLWCDRVIESAFPLDVDWSSLMSLFSAGWFTRFWIIQEVAFSRDVLVIRGKHSIKWLLLAVIAHYVVLNGWSALHIKDHMGISNTLAIAKARDGHSFLSDAQQRFEATDPRDRAFALYGLLSIDAGNKKMREAFRPDYHKTLCEVYSDITKASIMHSSAGLARILSAQRLVPRLDVSEVADHFPSWVPRYDFVEDTNRGAYRNVYFDLDLRQPHSPDEDDVQPHVLCVSGVVLDQVTEVITPLTATSSDTIDAEVLRALGVLWARFNQLNPNTTEACLATRVRDVLTAALVPTERRTVQFSAFVHEHWPEPKPLDILVAGSESDEDSDLAFNTDEEYELDTMKKSTEELVVLDQDIDDSSASSSEIEMPDEDEGKNADATVFYHDMLRSCVNRPFVFDSTGNLGSAGRLVRAGDQICTLRGLPVPVILRQSGLAFTFVSDIYMESALATSAELDRPSTIRGPTQDGQPIESTRGLERIFDLV